MHLNQFANERPQSRKSSVLQSLENQPTRIASEKAAHPLVGFVPTSLHKIKLHHSLAYWFTSYAEVSCDPPHVIYNYRSTSRSSLWREFWALLKYAFRRRGGRIASINRYATSELENMYDYRYPLTDVG